MDYSLPCLSCGVCCYCDVHRAWKARKAAKDNYEMKKFTLDAAKEKFVSPLREIFQREPLSPTRCWIAVARLFEVFCTPKPFAGKWPTRVLIFKTSDDWERVYCFYFGKRTGRFRINDILDFSQKRVFWLEFDRENYVRFFDFSSRRMQSNSNLMQQHYYRDRSLRNGDISRYGIVHLQAKSDSGGAYYFAPEEKGRLRTEPFPITAADFTSVGITSASLPVDMLSAIAYEEAPSEAEPGQ